MTRKKERNMTKRRATKERPTLMEDLNMLLWYDPRMDRELWEVESDADDSYDEKPRRSVESTRRAHERRYGEESESSSNDDTGSGGDDGDTGSDDDYTGSDDDYSESDDLSESMESTTGDEETGEEENSEESTEEESAMTTPTQDLIKKRPAIFDRTKTYLQEGGEHFAEIKRRHQWVSFSWPHKKDRALGLSITLIKFPLRIMGVAADGKAPIAYDYFNSTQLKVGTVISDPSVVGSEEYFEHEGKLKEDDAQEEEKEEGGVQPKVSPKKASEVDTPFFVHLETHALTSETGASTLSTPLSSNESKVKNDYESLRRMYEGLNKDKIKQLPLAAITVKKKAAPRIVAPPMKVVARPTEEEVAPDPVSQDGGRRVIPEEEFQMVKRLYDSNGKRERTKNPEELKKLPSLFMGDTVSLASDQSILKTFTYDSTHTTEPDLDFEAIKRLYANSNKKMVDSLLSEVDAKKSKEESISKHALPRMPVLEEEGTDDSSTNSIIAQVKLAAVARKDEVAVNKSLELARPTKNGSSSKTVRPTPKHSSPRNVQEIDFESVKILYDGANKSASSPSPVKKKTSHIKVSTPLEVKAEETKQTKISSESVSASPRMPAQPMEHVDFESVKKLYAAGLDDVEKLDFFKTTKKSRSKKGKAAKKKRCTDTLTGWTFDEDLPPKQSRHSKTKGAAACEFPIREIELTSKESSHQTKKFSISLPTDFNPAKADSDEETRDQSPKSLRRPLPSQSRRDDSSPPESPVAAKKMGRKKSKSHKKRRPGNVESVSVPVSI